MDLATSTMLASLVSSMGPEHGPAGYVADKSFSMTAVGQAGSWTESLSRYVWVVLKPPCPHWLHAGLQKIPRWH